MALRKVFKWIVSSPADEVQLYMHHGAEVIHVGEQHGQLCIWALIDESAPRQHRSFRIAGTGHDVDCTTWNKYLGTVHLAGGALIFHVFEFDLSTAINS